MKSVITNVHNPWTMWMNQKENNVPPPTTVAPMASLGRFHAAQTQLAASPRLLAQPAWNDARGGILA